MSEVQWFYADTNGAQQGPVDASWLRDAIQRGELGLNSMVWRDGLAQWVPLQHVAAEIGLSGTPASPQAMPEQGDKAPSQQQELIALAKKTSNEHPEFVALAIIAVVSLLLGWRSGLSGFVWSFVSASAAWVYWDATRHRIGKVGDSTGVFNMPAGGWALATLGLWIVAFPAYLFKRSELIARAALHPVEATSHSVKLGALTAFAGLVILDTAIFGSSGSLPGCGDDEVQSTLKDILKKQGIYNARVDGPTELSYDSKSETRSCKVVVSQGDEVTKVNYTVEWADKDAKRFLVQITTD